MIKRVFSIIMVLFMTVSLISCSANKQEKSTNEVYKIGIITGDGNQSIEEMIAVEALKKELGDVIVSTEYPDDFYSNPEVISKSAVELIQDESVKAIVFCQAVTGTADAIKAIREINPDILAVSCVPAENADVISEQSDLVMSVDDIATGEEIPRQAKRMGATRFVHYSFPRHLGYKSIAERRKRMILVCEEIGIEFIDASAPDPLGDAGIEEAKQFIADDLPKKLEEYGKDTAFFSTNCGLQEPLIRGVAELGMIYPQQCCPSPYHGYPEALGIDLTEHQTDTEFLLKEIQKKLREKNQETRMSTWQVSINQVMLKAGVYYAKEWIEGSITERNNKIELERILDQICEKNGTEKITLNQYSNSWDNAEDLIDNYYTLIAPYVDFSKDL